jgi:hypothetical protein
MLIGTFLSDQGEYFLKSPDMIRNACFHCWRDAQRLIPEHRRSLMVAVRRFV